MKSKTLTLTMTVRAPAGMKVSDIKREVATRINDVNGYFAPYHLGLPNSWQHEMGFIRIRASRIKKGA